VEAEDFVIPVPPPAGGHERFHWSVMVPTYNPRRDYLEQTLNSVLDQDPGAEKMQIEVVDDASPDVDVAEMVRSLGRGRAMYFRSAKNLGLAGCWNQCIERSRGRWVHILHQDDYVLPGFYERLDRAAASHPDAGLLATRAFFVNEEGIVTGLTRHIPSLEKVDPILDDFFYANPLQFPGVVVRRSVYGSLGGFRPDLSYTLDCEMWVRVIGKAGGAMTPEILACYRLSSLSETSRLARTAEGPRDLLRLSAIFAERYAGFDRKKAERRVLETVLGQTRRFSNMGDVEAAKANWKFWKEHATGAQRLRRFAAQCVRRIVG
jgi:GT2 family glycosyltransferase